MGLFTPFYKVTESWKNSVQKGLWEIIWSVLFLKTGILSKLSPRNAGSIKHLRYNYWSWNQETSAVVGLIKRKTKKHLGRKVKLSGGLKGATEPLGVPFDSNQGSPPGCQSSCSMWK